MKNMLTKDTTDKVNEVIEISLEKGWSEEDLYYVAKILLALFKDD
ncbi:hypothetical protein [Planococcus wigleyi]|nr:hypothetical protein [Planococcus wigleyi]